MRLVIETDCEHGATEAICVFNTEGCLGGSRRVVEVDYEAAAKASVGDGYEVEDFHRKIAREIVDAALGLDG